MIISEYAIPSRQRPDAQSNLSTRRAAARILQDFTKNKLRPLFNFPWGLFSCLLQNLQYSFGNIANEIIFNDR